jgi:hypothetical protein
VGNPGRTQDADHVLPMRGTASGDGQAACQHDITLAQHE